MFLFRKLIIPLLVIGIVLPIQAQNKAHYSDNGLIQQLFNQAIDDHAFPGGCLLVGSAHRIFIDQCAGYFTYDKKRKDQRTDLFDLASLTKVVATTAAIMHLYDIGKIHLNDKVVDYLPAFKGANAKQTQLKSKITIKDLLTHSSGLPAGTKANHWKAVYKTPVIKPRHRVTIYSDVNFLLLGKIVEKITGMSLAAYTQKTIFQPLKMHHTYFLPAARYQHLVVPTSKKKKHTSVKNNRVNDPTAFKLGGVAGNAGLFSSLNDLGHFCQMLLNQGKFQGKQIFKPSTLALFTKPANVITNSSRALGWDTVYNPDILKKKSYQTPHQFTAGLYIDSHAYGHSGYTGTSIWISPKHHVFVVLLTNRVYPHVSQKTHNEKYWRQRLNSAAWKILGFNHKNLTYRELKA